MKNLPAKHLIYHRRITHLQPTSVRSNAPTRKKTRDTGRSCFEATVAIDARRRHAAIDPRGISTGICGWLLRFLIFGPRKRFRHIMSRFFMAFSDLPIVFWTQCSDFDRTTGRNAPSDMLKSNMQSSILASISQRSSSSPQYHIIVG